MTKELSLVRQILPLGLHSLPAHTQNLSDFSNGLS